MLSKQRFLIKVGGYLIQVMMCYEKRAETNLPELITMRNVQVYTIQVDGVVRCVC